MVTARVLAIHDLAEARTTLEALDVPPAAVGEIAGRLLFRVVQLEGLPADLAGALIAAVGAENLPPRPPFILSSTLRGKGESCSQLDQATGGSPLLSNEGEFCEESDQPSGGSPLLVGEGSGEGSDPRSVPAHATGIGSLAVRTDEPGRVLLAGTVAQIETLGAWLVGAGGPLAQIGQVLQETLGAYAGRPRVVEARGQRFEFGRRVLVMGIVNATPDSFYDQGRHFGQEASLAHALDLFEEGADLVEVGGQTAQPSKPEVPIEEEIRRVAPLVEAIVRRTGRPVAVDTYRPAVARAALEAGACLLNDIGGLARAEMARLAAEYGALLVVMHIRNRPKVDFHQPEHRWSLGYRSVVDEVAAFLRERARQAEELGVARERILIDPGLGFDKLYYHDLELLHRLAELRSLGYPIFLATSRKNYLGELLQLPIEEVLEATAAAVAYGVVQGADLVRVHDVPVMARLCRLLEYATRRVPPPPPEAIKLWKSDTRPRHAQDPRP